MSYYTYNRPSIFAIVLMRLNHQSDCFVSNIMYDSYGILKSKNMIYSTIAMHCSDICKSLCGTRVKRVCVALRMKTNTNFSLFHKYHETSTNKNTS